MNIIIIITIIQLFMRQLTNKYLAVVLALAQGVRQDCTDYDVVLIDSYGDGWNGNVLTIDGQTFGSDFVSGYESYGSVCLDDGCYDVTVDGGSY